MVINRWGGGRKAKLRDVVAGSTGGIVVGMPYVGFAAASPRRDK